MRHTTAITALALVAGISLTACSPGQLQENTSTTSTTQDEASIPRFGGAAYVFDDGITVSLSSTERFEPSESAVAGTEQTRVRFTVTITNGSDEVFDPALVYLTMSSGGLESSEVFDTENGLEGPPQTPVLPGKSIEYDAGFGVTDEDDLTARISLNDLVHDDVTFIS